MRFEKHAQSDQFSCFNTNSKLKFRRALHHKLLNLKFTFKQTESSSMPPSGMWRRVGFVRTDVSEKRVPSVFKVEKSAIEGKR
jgi:hypothetical protein